MKVNIWFRAVMSLLFLVCLAGLMPAPGQAAAAAERLRVVSAPGATAQPAVNGPAGYPWIFLGPELSPHVEETGTNDERASGTGQIDSRPIELLIVGDIAPGRGLAGQVALLDQVVPWLRRADLAIGNLEGALGEEEQSAGSAGGPGGPFPLFFPPSGIPMLREAGFDLLGLANNHALDGGPDALETLAGDLRLAGIVPAGAGSSLEAAEKPVILEAGGLRVAVLAFNALPDPSVPAGAESGIAGGWQLARWDPVRSIAAVRRARQQADCVIVSIHWGYEYQSKVDPVQVRIGAALIEAGADLVAGHHPHVVQAAAVVPAADTENGRRGVVAYSLGNFLFDQAFGATREGLALRVLIDRLGLRGVQALPIQAGPRPRLLDLETGEALLERMLLPTQTVAFTCDPESCILSDPVELSGSGIFQTGQADLTGDGQPEEILLEEGRLAIRHANRAAWESPPEWQVLDAAAGDADGDGRVDLAVALLKPDSSGALRSHPFVIGFRGGRYRPLWGGSAVARPVIELELGDIDADGETELLVLEEGPHGIGRTLSIWRWHGWGFSLQWRSTVGDYQDLIFLPAEEQNPPRLLALLRGH